MAVIMRRQKNFWVRATSSFLLLGLLAMLVAAFVPVTRADDGNDLVRGLTNDHYYISQDVKDKVVKDATFKKDNPNLDADTKNAVNAVKGKKDVRIAIISNQIIPPKYNNNNEDYANFLLGFLSNPKPDAVVVVNAQTKIVSLVAKDLSDTERKAITDNAVSTFASSGLAAGAKLVAQQTADKISNNARGSIIGTIIIVLVVLLAIGGVVAYMLITTQKKWKEKLGGVERLANQVSDLVLRVSDDVNFLPDAARVRGNSDFGAATQNFAEANSHLHELQTVSPVVLLLQGANYDRRLNLTGAQFEQVRQGLQRVEQQIGKSLP